MRAAPAFRVTVNRFGWWRAGIVAGLSLTVASVLAWTVLTQRPSASVVVAVWAATVAAAAGAASLLRIGCFTLRWDTQVWRLQAGPTIDESAPAGDLSVAIDLGAWMLLRFVPRDAPRRRGSRWLPVQRQGLEADWHTFRCTVYSPRTDAGRDADHVPSASRSRDESHA